MTAEEKKQYLIQKSIEMRKKMADNLKKKLKISRKVPNSLQIVVNYYLFLV